MKCVDARQKSMPLGKTSMSFKMVDPVVVNPDTLSNMALANENSPPHKKYGIVPIIHVISQPNTLIPNPSWKLTSSGVSTNI